MQFAARNPARFLPPLPIQWLQIPQPDISSPYTWEPLLLSSACTLDPPAKTTNYGAWVPLPEFLVSLFWGVVNGSGFLKTPYVILVFSQGWEAPVRSDRSPVLLCAVIAWVKCKLWFSRSGAGWDSAFIMTSDTTSAHCEVANWALWHPGPHFVHLFVPNVQCWNFQQMFETKWNIHLPPNVWAFLCILKST